MRKLLSVLCLLIGGLIANKTAMAQGGQATEIRYGATLPSTCATHQIFSYTAGSPAIFEFCKAANTWAGLPLSLPDFQVNSVDVLAQTTINFLNSANFNGLTFTFTNGSAGNITLGATGTLNNSGLTNSSYIFVTTSPLSGGGTYSLGSTITLGCSGCVTSLPIFQVDGTNLSNQSTVNFEDAAAYQGLTLTMSNPSAGNVQPVLGGALGNAGLANSSVSYNGQSVSLGGSGNVNAGAATHSMAINEGAGAVFAGVALAAHQVPVGGSGDPTAVTIVNCLDSAGQHLNYTQASDSFSCGNTSSGGGGGSVTINWQNNTVTGTTLNKLATLSSNQAILPTATTGAYNGIIGVCTSGCGTSGNATITTNGVVSLVFDGNTTINDWIVESITVNGDAHDTGSTTYPLIGGTALGIQVLGRVNATASGGAGQTVSASYFSPGNQTTTTSSSYYPIPALFSQTGYSASPLQFGGSSTGNSLKLLFGAYGASSVTGAMFELQQQVSGAIYSTQLSNTWAIASGTTGPLWEFLDSGGTKGTFIDSYADLVYKNNTVASTTFGTADYSATQFEFGTSGTSQGFRLQKLTSSTSALTNMTTTDSFGSIGVQPQNVINNSVVEMGRVTMEIDGTATAGDYLIPSTTTNGYAHTNGTSWPFFSQVIGRLLTTTSGSNPEPIWQYGAEIRGGAYGAAAPVNLTTITSSVAATSLLTPGADGQFRVCYVLTVTTAGSAGTAAVSISYTDENGAQTDTSATLSLAVTGKLNPPCFPIWARSTAPIQYAVPFLLATGSPNVKLHLRIEAE